MLKKIFVALIAIWTSSCQQQQAGSANFDKTKIAEEIRKVNTSIYEAGNDKNPAKLYSHFSDKVTGVFDGAVMGSWDEHKKEGKAFFGSQKEIKYTIDSIYSIDVISNEVSVLTGTYSLSAIDTLGNGINTSHAWTYVFNKQNGDWKVVHFHQSTKPK